MSSRAKRQAPLSPRAIALTLLACSAAVIWAGQRAAGSAASADVSQPVPEQVGLWTGRPIEVPDRSLEILETDDVALMEYRLGQEPPLWFARVAGFGKRAAFHPPELCYVGSHFEILERGPVDVFVNGKEQRVMRLLLAKDQERVESWYWFTAGERVTPNYYQQQLWLLADLVRRRPASGTLVRISTPVDSRDSASRRLLAFVASWDMNDT
jgi:EpsI family protein